MRRLRDALRLPDDPFLKAGIIAMAFAMSLVCVVAFAAFLDKPMAPVAVKSTAKAAAEPLVRSDPGVDPWVERNIPAPRPEPKAEAAPQPDPDPKPSQEPRREPDPQPNPELNLDPKPQAQPAPQPESEPQPEPEAKPEQKTLPVSEDDWPAPTDEEREAASEPRRYDLPPGAIMGLTVRSMEIYNAPIFDSVSQWALTNGVAHEPETSLPWSRTPERNVYLAGHRMGYSGTRSRMIFYHLDKLGEGDEILLRDRDGAKYQYRVIDAFVVDPSDTWVMGRVRGRDLLTLQTCTPIPAFDKRLIVRAERV